VTCFALNMAWRETRAAWRHFLYCFVCIALGVSALVGVGLFAANVERAVTREARGLLGGDLEVRTSRPMGESGELVLRSLTSRGIGTTHVSELVAMAATVNGNPTRSGPVTQIVELKAVESGYPLYGTVKTEPDRPLSSLLALIETGCAPLPCHGAVVQESLLIRMGLSVGDRLKIGQGTFLITGVIRKEPDRMANVFSLGPRVMISRDGLAAAELVKPGSRVRERYLLKASAEVPIQPLLDELRGRLAREMARVSSYREAQPQLKQFLEQLSRYLGLVGLTALFVGGIGVATSVQAFLREKLLTIAILKTLGADSATVVKTYLGQALFLGLLGSAAGAGLGVALQHLLPGFLDGMLAANVLEQIEFSSALTWGSLPPLFKGVALGMLTTLLFSVWPLLGIREIRPALIVRREVAEPEAAQAAGASSRLGRWLTGVGVDDPVRAITAICIMGGLAGLSMWQAGSWKVGLVFLGALILAIVLLSVAAAALVRAIRRLPAPRSLAVRYAIGNLYRPGSQATGILVSVGIGVMIIVAIWLLERSLVRQLGENRPEDAPTFFFIDIQPDQADAFVGLLHERTGDLSPQLTPLVRSRLSAINGQPVKIEEGSAEERDKPQDKRKSWYVTREYVLTFLDRLPQDNEVVKGEWWSPGQVFTKPLVSVEEEAARNLGLDVGSVVEFEIQGSTVSAEVSSIRKVKWGNFSTNFYMILSPGSLDGAPLTYVATARVPPQDEIPLQQAVVAAFPNVTAINIGDVLDSFARLLDRLSLAIRAVALFCILSGALVMAAALAATRYRRLYESVIFKALGATRGLIARSFATEYSLLGMVAGMIGAALASALSWAVLYFILDLPWSLQPGVLTVGFLLTVALTLTVGFLTTFRILGQRPLAVLRQE
jgi:putative ABC transport system permease protein